MLELFPAFVLLVKILSSRRYTQDGCFGVGEILCLRGSWPEDGHCFQVLAAVEHLVADGRHRLRELKRFE